MKKETWEFYDNTIIFLSNVNIQNNVYDQLNSEILILLPLFTL